MSQRAITKRACGVAVQSDAIKAQVQERLSPAIGQLTLEGRVVPVYINVYFSINRVGGACPVLTGMLPCVDSLSSKLGSDLACALLFRSLGSNANPEYDLVGCCAKLDQRTMALPSHLPCSEQTFMTFLCCWQPSATSPRATSLKRRSTHRLIS